MSSIRHVIRWVDRSDAVYFGAETLDEMAERYDFDATAAAAGEVELRDAHGAIVGWVMPAQPKHPHPGRPLLGREKRRRYLVTLEPHTAETARRLGAGNLSAGLTQAVHTHPHPTETLMDRNAVQTLIDRGYVAAVVMAYDGAGRARGEIVSRHRSYAAAERKARGSTFWSVRYLTDLREDLPRL